MADCNLVLIEAQENYQKKSYRNKCRLIGPNGFCSFSIPLQKGKHNGTAIKKVKISYDEDWSGQFLKLLQSNYSKSPYYDFLIDNLQLILGQNHQYLFDLNMDLLDWIFKFLQFETEIKLTESYYTTAEESIEDLREHFKPGKDSDRSFKPYAQVFLEKHGFIPHMSILDLLFCCGRESLNYL